MTNNQVQGSRAKPIIAEAGFAANIKARRLALGFTLRDVEKITDGAISNGYLSQLENGKIANPSAHVVIALGAAYAVDYTEMWSWLSIVPVFREPEICSECGRAKPLSYVIDAPDLTLSSPTERTIAHDLGA